MLARGARITLRSACNKGGATEPCRLEGSQCNAGYAGECQGSKLLVCVDGYKLGVDCAAIGFDLCGTPPPDRRPACMHAL